MHSMVNYINGNLTDWGVYIPPTFTIQLPTLHPDLETRLCVLLTPTILPVPTSAA